MGQGEGNFTRIQRRASCVAWVSLRQAAIFCRGTQLAPSNLAGRELGEESSDFTFLPPSGLLLRPLIGQIQLEARGLKGTWLWSLGAECPGCRAERRRVECGLRRKGRKRPEHLYTSYSFFLSLLSPFECLANCLPFFVKSLYCEQRVTAKRGPGVSRTHSVPTLPFPSLQSVRSRKAILPS